LLTRPGRKKRGARREGVRGGLRSVLQRSP
jgi:hypothetical protein